MWPILSQWVKVNWAAKINITFPKNVFIYIIYAINTDIMHCFFMCMFVFNRCIILIKVLLDLVCQATMQLSGAVSILIIAPPIIATINQSNHLLLTPVKHSYANSLKSFSVIGSQFQRGWDPQTLYGPFYQLAHFT